MGGNVFQGTSDFDHGAIEEILKTVKKKDINQLAIPSLINKILIAFKDKIY